MGGLVFDFEAVRTSAQAQKALVSLREAEHVTDDMRDGQLRLSREAAELADRADRGEAVDADELSGMISASRGVAAVSRHRRDSSS